MANLSIVVPVEYDVSAEQVAKLFCAMEGEEQAEFFNAVAEEVDSWSNAFCFQLQAILDSHRLNAGGIAIMQEIGEYGVGAVTGVFANSCREPEES